MALYRFFTGTAVSAKTQKHDVYLKPTLHSKNRTWQISFFQQGRTSLVLFFYQVQSVSEKRRVFEFLLKRLYQ